MQKEVVKYEQCSADDTTYGKIGQQCYGADFGDLVFIAGTTILGNEYGGCHADDAEGDDNDVDDLVGVAYCCNGML